MAGRSLQQKIMLDFHVALGSSLDLRTVIDTAFPLLARLIPVDCGAFCVSNPAITGGYDWATVDFPVNWFSAYAEMAPHDFVQKSVLAAPNVVLLDSDMITREALEANMMYRRAREIGAPLEQVMSVMLDLSDSWHAGITLYRGRPSPFSGANKALLQQVTPWVGNAVRNCKLFAEESRRGDVLDAVLRIHGTGVVIMSSQLTAITRTDGITSLIARWFEPAELDRYGLPVVVLDQLRSVARTHGTEAERPDTWTKASPRGVLLKVMFIPITEGSSRTVWAITFQEAGQMPDAWRLVLSPREVDVTLRVLLGWDNQLIADDLGCSPATVKKHLQHIFDKLGVSSRTALCHLASRRG